MKAVLLLPCLLLLSGCGPTWPDLTRPLDRLPDPQPTSGDLAVIVAIGDYAEVADIPGAVDNGRALARWLRGAQGVRPTRIRQIFDRDATAERIRSAVEHAVDEVRPGERLWFIYIGHGMSQRVMGSDGARNDGLLVAADAPADAMRLSTAGVPYRDIARALAAVEHVAIIDACFSGVDRRGEPLLDGLQPLVWSAPDAGAKGVTLTASTGLQFAGQLPRGEVPAFSYLVAGALRGWGDLDGDGRVTAAEVREWVHEALQTLDAGRSQHPQLFGRAELVLGAGAESAPELEPIRPAEPAGPWLLAAGGLASVVGGLVARSVNQDAADAASTARVAGDRGAYDAAYDESRRYASLAFSGYGLGALALIGAVGWRLAVSF